MEQDQQKQTLEESSRPEAIGVTRAMHQSKVRGRKRRTEQARLSRRAAHAGDGRARGRGGIFAEALCGQRTAAARAGRAAAGTRAGASGAAIRPRTRRAGDARSGPPRNRQTNRLRKRRRNPWRLCPQTILPNRKKTPLRRPRPHRFPPKRTPHRRSTSSFYSEHAILIDLETNTVIAEKDSDAKIYPASMTK